MNNGKESIDFLLFCDRMNAITKGNDEDGRNEIVPREPGQVETRRQSVSVPIPSEPELRTSTVSVGGSRNAALKHKVCWNLSGAKAQFEWYRGQATLVSSN